MSRFISILKNNLKDELKKAVIYCRVSTKEQADEGNSLVSQERICREFAAKEGYEIAQVFVERGESAKTANRTQLNLLMKLCTSKKDSIQAVIAYKVDRISRNLADYGFLRGTLKRYGVEIRSVTEPFEDTPAGRFMENIIANVGQFDNDVRAERCLGGMIEAIKEGRYVWMAPPGYINLKVNGKSTIAPNAKAPLILKVFELIDTTQYTTNAIRIMIAEDGLVNRKGDPITCSNFFTLIRNPIYKGTIKKFGNEYKGGFAPIVPIDLFDRVQDILSGRKKTISHYLHENPDFPLRRFMSDNHGNKATGYWSKGKRLKYPYYSFKQAKSTIRKEILEQKFMDLLSQFEFDPASLRHLHFYLKEVFQKQLKNEVDESDLIELQIADLNRRIDALIELKANKAIGLQTFTDRMQKLEPELIKLKELMEIEPNKDLNIDELISFAINVLTEPGLLWQQSPLHVKQGLQVFYFPEGVIYDGEICRTPTRCNLFKLKSQIESDFFSRVDLTDERKNTHKMETLPPSTISIHTKAYWQAIVEDLIKLKLILSGKKEWEVIECERIFADNTGR